MKNLLVFIVAILCGPLVWAQGEADSTEETPKYWTTQAAFGLNITNVGFTYWAGGGQPSLSIAGLVKANATYKKGHITWVNALEAGYGIIRQKDDYDNILLRKSDDRFVVSSKWSKEYGETPWAFTALAEFRTQLTDGFTYAYDENNMPQQTIISRLMAPAYLTMAVGGEYKPSDKFYMMASPVSGKVTFVLDQDLADLGAFGVDPGKTVRTELGAIFNAKWIAPVMKNVKYETKVNLFQAYRKGAFIDIMWDNILEMKVNDFITSTFSTQLIYDEDVMIADDAGVMAARVQFKHVLNVGLLIQI